MCALSLSEKIIVRRKVSGVCYVLDPDLDGNTSAESLETIYLLHIVTSFYVFESEMIQFPGFRF